MKTAKKTQLKISLVKPDLIPKIARIHYESLPDDFLPKLGLDFLTDVFYSAAIQSPFCKVFVGREKSNQPAGFMLVTTDSGKFLKDIIRKRSWDFVKVGMCSSFQSLAHLSQNVEIVFAGLFSPPSQNLGEIYVIAVAESFRGKGIGRALVNKSIEFLKEEHMTGITIKTLASNSLWRGFFVNEGWTLERSFRLIGSDYVSYRLMF